MMRFLADENVSRVVIARLRAAGFEVIRSPKRAQAFRTRMFSLWLMPKIVF